MLTVNEVLDAFIHAHTVVLLDTPGKVNVTERSIRFRGTSPFLVEVLIVEIGPLDLDGETPLKLAPRRSGQFGVYTLTSSQQQFPTLYAMHEGMHTDF